MVDHFMDRSAHAPSVRTAYPDLLAEHLFELGLSTRTLRPAPGVRRRLALLELVLFWRFAFSHRIGLRLVLTRHLRPPLRRRPQVHAGARRTSRLWLREPAAVRSWRSSARVQRRHMTVRFRALVRG